MTDPLPEITRVRGGGSARLGAVVVAIALVAIVWVGISGRPNPAPISAVPADATGAPTLSTTRPVPAVPSPMTTPAPTPGPGDTYGASLAIGKLRYVTILSELEPGHLTGELHFPSPARLPSGTFAFSELWHDGHVDAAVAINEWTVDLEALVDATRTPAAVIEEKVGAQSALLDVPPPVTRGYDINVIGSNDLLFSRLSIEVRLGDGTTTDDGRGTVTVRFGVRADLGNSHPALILSPAENGSFKGTLTLPKPRRPVDAQLRLYNVQLTVSHDIWTEIQQFTLALTPEMAKLGVSKLVLDEDYATYQLVARTSGNVRGQSISVTVIARRLIDAE